MVSHKKGSNKRWVRTVTTDSTHPAPGLFTKSPTAIARALASNKVSPKGPGSGMRMLNYFINRGGRGLSATRRRNLEAAKRLLSKRIAKGKKSKVGKKRG
jgi:hypothetical protein